MSFQAGDTVGPYRVVKQLAAGASGEVYRVQHTLTNRVEAMKILKGGAFESAESEQRFLREIQVQASLSHPNIAAVHNAFIENGRLVMTMEFVEGQRLDALLARKALTLAEAAGYACQMLDALEYAHAHGVVHRDVSSANVIVTEQGLVKLTDFGLAKTSANLRLTQHGVPIGSYPYMSPEQVRGLPDVDGRSDLYSTGVLLYEMVTKRLPFRATDPFTMMQAHVNAEHIPAHAWLPWLPPGWEELFAAALAKDPRDRFSSAAHFQAVLRSLSWALLPSTQPSAPVTNKRRERPRWVLAAAAAAIALIAVGSKWIAQRPRTVDIPPGPLPVVEAAKPSPFPRPATTPPAAVPEIKPMSKPAVPLTPEPQVADEGEEKQADTEPAADEQAKVSKRRNPIGRAFGKVFRLGRKQQPAPDSQP